MSESKLSLKTIIFLVINSVIGTSIFLLPGKSFSLMGPGSLLMYFVVATIMICIALCFAECGSMFKESGGPYLYAREAFGNFVGFEVGVMKWISSMIALAALAASFVTAASALFPTLANPLTSKLIQTGIIFILCLINLGGVDIIGKLNNLISIGKIIPMILVIALSFFFIKGSNFTPVFPNGVSTKIVATSFLAIFYSFTGYENTAVAAADLDNPEKNVPKALIIGMLIISALYILIHVGCIGVLGQSLSTSNTPVADVMGKMMGNSGVLIVTIATMISCGGCCIAGSFFAPRSAEALANDKYLPTCFKTKNKKGVPYLSIIITSVITMIIAMSGNYITLALISAVARFTQYIPTALAVIVLRKKRPDLKATYRVPFGPVIPVLSVVVSLWLVFNTNVKNLICGLGAMVVIAPIYFIMKAKREKSNN